MNNFYVKGLFDSFGVHFINIVIEITNEFYCERKHIQLVDVALTRVVRGAQRD